jgi:hypothetical protein
MANASDIGKQVAARTPEVAGGMLRSIVDFAIYGNEALPGAKTIAARALQERGDREAAIDSLVMQHIGLASAQGFLTSVGGLITLPVGLPANIAGMAVLGVRMVASVAHLRGYELDDPRVRSAVTLAMLGDDQVRKLISTGKLPTTPLAVATAPVFDPELERKISERVMGSLASRMGGKHLAVVVVRRIPLVGGGVGAVVDGWLTFGLAAYVKREFVGRQQITRGPLPDA